MHTKMLDTGEGELNHRVAHHWPCTVKWKEVGQKQYADDPQVEE